MQASALAELERGRAAEKEGDFKGAITAFSRGLVTCGYPSDDVLLDEPQLAAEAIPKMIPDAFVLFQERAQVLLLRRLLPARLSSGSCTRTCAAPPGDGQRQRRAQ
jgi:hypothetical protein